MAWRNWLVLLIIVGAESIVFWMHPLLSGYTILAFLLALSIDLLLLALLGRFMPNLGSLFFILLAIHMLRFWLLIENRVIWEIRGNTQDLSILAAIAFFISYMIASQFHLHFKARKSR
ncbi:hypothetical protein [Aestuariispira insulae]|uniref:Uncharacterized protein n=1 Tax=Aestuariispira insulae TaxID=1461337 RepID=A0A3D9H9I7_9PROT|nr:hypothetical protein [Aestuariispira insulae]RED46160.1 hypothetical protein DFP90_11069 [Aestuariispira insulae]